MPKRKSTKAAAKRPAKRAIKPPSDEEKQAIENEIHDAMKKPDVKVKLPVAAENLDKVAITDAEIPQGHMEDEVICPDCGQSYVAGSPHAEFCPGKA